MTDCSAGLNKADNYTMQSHQESRGQVAAML